MISKKLWDYLISNGFKAENPWIDWKKDGTYDLRCTFSAPMETEASKKYDHIDLYLDLVVNDNQAFMDKVTEFYHSPDEMIEELMVFKDGEGNMLDSAECTLNSYEDIPVKTWSHARKLAEGLFSLSLNKLDDMSDEITSVEADNLSEYDFHYDELSEWYQNAVRKTA